MGDDNPIDELATEIRGLLDESADDLVQRWIEWIRARIGTSTVHSLPDVALRNHIPPVLRAVGRYVEVPLEAVRSELIGHLELHGHLRWQQGYGIQELLAEFDGLAHLVTRQVHEHIAQRSEGVPSEALMEVMTRLSVGLRAIGYVTVSIYRKAESEHRRELARHMDDFAASIAHEIRNPMNTLSLGLELAERQATTEDAKWRRHIGAMQASLKRMSDLVDNLRILGRVEKADSKGRQVSLTTAVQEVREALARTANENEVPIIVEGEIPQVSAASVPLQLALMNLVSNALKYYDPEKSDRWCKISVSLLEGEGTPKCEITVADNGLGIPADLREAVLQRHVRAHPAVAEGTGLGLDISRQVLMRFGGSLVLESEEGSGTTVRIRLPVIDKSVHTLDSDDLAKSDLARMAVQELADSSDD